MDDKIISKEVWPKLIGRHIRINRIRKGLTQSELAARVKSGVSHISNIENGKVELGSYVFVKIQQELDLHQAEYTTELNEAITEYEKGL